MTGCRYPIIQSCVNFGADREKGQNNEKIYLFDYTYDSLCPQGVRDFKKSPNAGLYKKDFDYVDYGWCGGPYRQQQQGLSTLP